MVALPDIARKFHIFADAGVNPATGGIATLVSKDWFPDVRSLRHQVIAIGRISRVELASDERRLIFWNVHNHDVPDIAMETVSCSLDADIDDAAANPLAVSVFVAGDFNFLAPGEHPFRPALVADAPGEDPAVRVRLGQRAWTARLDKLTVLASVALGLPAPGRPPPLSLQRH